MCKGEGEEGRERKREGEEREKGERSGEKRWEKKGGEKEGKEEKRGGRKEVNNQVCKQGTQHTTFLCASQVESSQQPSASPQPQTHWSLLHPCSKPTTQLQPWSNTSLLLLSKVQPQTQPSACT